VFKQRAAFKSERRHHRNFALGQFLGKSVLLQNLRVRPAIGAVELGDQRRAFVHADLINAVFIAVEGKLAAIGTQTETFNGIEHAVRRELGIGMGHAGIVRAVRKKTPPKRG
jgi:hypothetical protein